jgi:hypothetical protein
LIFKSKAVFYLHKKLTLKLQIELWENDRYDTQFSKNTQF